jgi:transcriptional regulator with XRE-family HTH domain
VKGLRPHAIDRLAANLKAARGEKLTQRQVYLMTRLTTNYLSLVETGKRVPTLHTLAVLARAYKTTISALLEGVSPGGGPG